MQLSTSTARTARAAGVSLYACTCGLKTGYASSSLIRQNSRRYTGQADESSSAGPSSQTYNAEDYHDPAHAQMLTARLAKTKKRMVKRGQDFVDKLTIQVKAGKGGDGGVAFHREKFVERGPPSGGNGGHGGNVYIKPVPHCSSLSHIKKTMLAHNGQAGAGSWLHGRRGNDLVIEVPYGTVIREIRQSQLSQQGEDSDNVFHPEDEEDASTETWSQWRKRLKEEKTTNPEATKERRAKMFVLYPTLDEDIDLLDNKIIDELEFSFLEEERREELTRLNKPPVEIDFDEKPSSSHGDDLEMEDIPASADRIAPKQDEKILLLRGGRGGFGNPYFTQPNSRRSPKLATRGRPGESMRLELELKTLADIGLVGFPNAGKSTVLQALTHSRSTIAPYAFTTMTPQIGTLIIYDDATYSTTTSSSPIEETASRSSLPAGSNRTRLARPADKDARQERLRLTIADCPGLLPNAADDVGLGHDFLRHIERSKFLIYVVDLSGKDPVKDLLVLKQELEEYKPGLSERARIIVANKADRVDEQDEASVQAIKAKLDGIRALAKEWQEVDGTEKIVIPMSAMMRGNVDAFVSSMVTVLEESTR